MKSAKYRISGITLFCPYCDHEYEVIVARHFQPTQTRAGDELICKNTTCRKKFKAPACVQHCPQRGN